MCKLADIMFTIALIISAVIGPVSLYAMFDTPEELQLECRNIYGEWDQFHVVETWNPYWRGSWHFKYRDAKGEIWRMEGASYCRYVKGAQALP